MSSEDQKRQVGSGLGQPIVTITKNPGSISRGISVPAGDNHPLAATTSTTSAVNPAAASGPTNAASLNLFKNPTMPPTKAAPPLQAQPRPVVAAPTGQRTRIIPAAASPPKSLESLADAFLSENSYRTTQLGLPPILRPTPLPREDGMYRLRTLVERRAWGDVLKIATSMLNDANDLHANVYASLVTPPQNETQVDASTVPPHIRRETVEIMTLQCHAWLKLRRYVDLATEVERWNFLTHNDATAQSPDWLPWGMHILAGQALGYTEEADRGTDVLFGIRDRIPDTEPLWILNVDNALANIFLRRGEWRLALGSLDRIMELIPAATEKIVRQQFASAANLSELESLLKVAYKCETLCRQGRTLLQVGALPQVAEIFELVNTTWNVSGLKIPPELVNHDIVKLMPVQLKVNEALFYFAQSHYDQAIESFMGALGLLRQLGNLSPKYASEDWMGPTIAGCDAPNKVYSDCVNNIALCHLYTCRMNEAVQHMEALIREDPTAFLSERVAFNLCTMYELGADSAASTRRKRVLQLIAKRFFLHDVGPESFRVT